MKSKTLEILKKCMKEKRAVGAFNTSNMEVTQAIVMAANNLKTPCIIQTTVSTMDYSYDFVGDMVESNVNRLGKETQIGFHLDHGKKMEDISRAIDLGVDSVMIDASLASFEDNLKITKKVVEYAHAKGVAVQAELGAVPYLGRESHDINWDEVMTDPEQAQILVEKTKVDALAVGIGNAHGFFRERSVPDWERLKAIRKKSPRLL